jgi:hypothetical protein
LSQTQPSRLGYSNFISAFISRDKGDKIADCGTDFIKGYCPHCGKVHVQKIGCKEWRLCPSCSEEYMKKKKVLAHDRFNMFKYDYVGYYVFTVPREYYHLFVDDKYVKRWRSIVISCLEDYYKADIGGVIVLHTVGEAKEITQSNIFKPHLNVLLPDLLLKDDRFVRLKKMVVDVNFIREKYTRRMNEEFGWDESVLDMHYNFAKRGRKANHRFKYVFKSQLKDFVVDMDFYPPDRYGEGGKVVLFNRMEYSLSFFRNEFYAMYESGRHNITWFGFMGNRKYRSSFVDFIAGHKVEKEMKKRLVAEVVEKEKRLAIERSRWLCDCGNVIVVFEISTKMFLWRSRDLPGNWVV